MVLDREIFFLQHDLKLSLMINKNKTKFMKIRYVTKEKQFDGLREEYWFEEVNSFNYLVVIVSDQYKMEMEIRARLVKINKSSTMLHRLLINKSLLRY